MKHYVILIAYDGFTKEMEYCFPNDEPYREFAIKSYDRFCPIIETDPLPANIHARKFYIRDQFYALGKNIVYYKEF